MTRLNKATIVLAALLLTSVVEARPFVFPVQTYNWSNLGGAVSTSSNTSSWATGSLANDVCTYSYTINGVTTGPIQIQANTCNVSVSTTSINGVSTSIVKVNGIVVN